MNLNRFMKSGISGIMKTAGRFYLGNQKGRAFLADMLPQMRKSARLREHSEAEGMHIPPFLIASIASQCNLHCTGCYARAGGSCCDEEGEGDLTGPEWRSLFQEAAMLGVSFVLLAGGEPLLRRDVIDAAAQCPNLIFPIFTNGTMVGEAYLDLFDRHRNLIPVLSIEGEKAQTDARRGAGTHAKIEAVMARLKEKKILFGTSVTVTRENMDAVSQGAFVSGLEDLGCGLVFFVEYVPAEEAGAHLVLDEKALEVLKARTDALKSQLRDMILLSFPGDEAAMGGCLASGRGFFHINLTGGAEPCPFSPYAKYNLRSSSMTEVLSSGYFGALRDIAAQAGPHMGGCVLWEREQEVKALLAGA